jgi:hypothetical protein
MLKSHYIEDIFIEFYETVIVGGINLQAQDESAANSFYHVLQDNKELTQNQANFLLKILQKYKMLVLGSEIDYNHLLDNPKWKKSFRILDFSKKIFVEKDEDGAIWVCAKFPYQLKKQFDDEFSSNHREMDMSTWDPERKLRKMYLYACNLVHLYEFAQHHGFEIDETFMLAIGDVEEIWQNQDEILPHSTIINGTVHLNNACADATDFWNNKSIGSVGDNLLLAKSMGFPYRRKPYTTIEKIASTLSNSFWIKENKQLFDLYNSINGIMCVVLDRTSNRLEWLKEFVEAADHAGVPRADIRVCFRESKGTNTGINTWVKEQGIGGPVDGGSIFIFEFKPAKWLFKEQEHVKLLVTNNLYPATNTITKDWLSSHPCVIYLGDIKPSAQRGHTIVEL